jgi:hypothetical protein
LPQSNELFTSVEKYDIMDIQYLWLIMQSSGIIGLTTTLLAVHSLMPAK